MILELLSAVGGAGGALGFRWLLSWEREDRGRKQRYAIEQFEVQLKREEEKNLKEYRLLCEKEFEEWDTEFFEDSTEWKSEEAELEYRKWKATQARKHSYYKGTMYQDYLNQLGSHPQQAAQQMLLNQYQQAGQSQGQSIQNMLGGKDTYAQLLQELLGSIGGISR